MTVDLADMYRRIDQHAPGLTSSNPGAGWALAGRLAKEPTPSSQPVEAVASFDKAVTLKSDLLAQAPDVQGAMWAKMNTAERNLLAKVGYAPPTPDQIDAATSDNGGGSFWHHVTHAVTHIGGDVLNALGSGLRALQHAYRTADQVAGVSGLHTPNLLQQAGHLLTTTPGEWSDAWHQTTDGQKVYNLKALNDAQKKYSPEVYGLAKKMADGQTIDQIAVSPDDYQHLVQLANSSDFKSAFDDIDSAHVSFGRDVARSLGFDPEVNIGPVHAHLVSGLADGVMDFTLDPLLIGGKAAKAAKLAKWGLAAADMGKVDRMFDNPSVFAAWQRITHNLNTIREGDDTAKGAAYADLRDRHPGMDALIQPMLDDGVTDVHSAREWMTGATGLTRTLIGQSAREAPLMPHTLSPFGEALISTKQGVRKVLDYTRLGGRIMPDADLLDPAIGTAARESRTGLIKGVPYRFGQITRRMTTRVTQTDKLDLADKNVLDTVRRVGLTYLPAAHVNRLVGAFAAADVAGKRQIYKGLLGQIGEASGITLTEGGREWWGKFMDDLDQWTREKAYSTTDAGKRLTDAGHRDLGILTSHMNEVWALPSFKDMHSFAAKLGVLDRFAGRVNTSFVDKFMGVWRWGVLTRLGFPLRAGMDEIAGALFRGQGKGLLKARAALYAARTDPNMARPAGIIRRTFAKMLPDEMAAKVTSPDDWYKFHALTLVRGVTRPAALKLAGPDYLDHVSRLSQDDLWRKSIGDQVVHSLQHDVKYEGSDAQEISRAGMTAAPVRWINDKMFKARSAQGMDGSIRWAHNLDQLMLDEAGHVAATRFGLESEQAIVDRLVKVIKSPGYKDTFNKAEVRHWTADGRSVKAGEATQDEAIRDWARDIYKHAESLLTSETRGAEAGDLVTKSEIKRLLQYIRTERDAPNASWLNELRDRPGSVVGMDFMPIVNEPGHWAKFSQKAFDVVVNRPMDWLSRQPLVTHYYTQARQHLSGLERDLVRGGMSPEAADDIVHRAAMERAVNHAVYYVHNPRMRTQFSVVARNFFPFRHAEEGFLTRWASSLKDSPEGLRKAQLVFMGAQHSGLVTKDDQGNWIFLYPGSNVMVDALRRIANLLPGVDIAKFPIPVNFTSQVDYLNPGLTELGTGHLAPPTGPFVGMGMSVLTHLFPESEFAQKADREVVGVQGAGKPIWEQFVPTGVSRLYSIWADHSESDGQLASATRSALAYLDATGHTPPPGATAEQVDAYINRVQSWARTVLMARAIFGFAAPAAPSAPDFDPQADEAYRLKGVSSLKQEFFDLTKRMTYAEAIQTFIQLHPDDSIFKGGSFLVPETKSVGGMFLPSTQKALGWMTQNAGFLKKYRRAAPLLVPDDPGAFNYDAYRMQLALGVRQHLSVSDFYQELKIQHAERTYYTARDKRDAALAQAKASGDTAYERQVNQSWHNWSGNFLGLNPLFNQYLSQGSTRAFERAQTISEMRNMLADPALPKNANVAGMRDLIDSYDRYTSYENTLYGYTTTAAEGLRSEARNSFFDYARNLVAANPDLLTVYDRVFRPLESA